MTSAECTLKRYQSVCWYINNRHIVHTLCRQLPHYSAWFCVSIVSRTFCTTTHLGVDLPEMLCRHLSPPVSHWSIDLFLHRSTEMSPCFSVYFYLPAFSHLSVTVSSPLPISFCGRFVCLAGLLMKLWTVWRNLEATNFHSLSRSTSKIGCFWRVFLTTP